jgi:hypothetical protein
MARSTLGQASDGRATILTDRAIHTIDDTRSSTATPYEYICKRTTPEPDGVIVHPFHQIPGLNA